MRQWYTAAALFAVSWTAACDRQANPLPTQPGITASKSRAAAGPGHHLVIDGKSFKGERYVVRFKDNAPEHAQLARTLAQAQGGSVIYVYQTVFKGFNVALPNDAAADAIRRNPNVLYVVPDARGTMAATQSPVGWGLDRIDQHANALTNSFNYWQTGSGVNIYIIDSGIQGTNPEFGGRFGTLSGTWVFPNNPYVVCNAHGTRVASVAAGTNVGVAKAALLNSLQVSDCSGNVFSGDVASAMDFVATNGTRPGVINWSGRVARNCCYNPIDDAVVGAYNAGFPVVISAGNDNADACNNQGASRVEAITVGATDTSDTRASFSNYGGCVKLFAPGVNVAIKDTVGGILTGTSGTSFAAPYVTGTIALMLQERSGLTPFNFRTNVASYTSVVTIGNANGSPNRLLYSPHTEISNPPQGPQSFACSYTGNATWSTTTWGGNGSYTYNWWIDYDNPLEDDEYPSTTSNTLTWPVNGQKGSFTIHVSVTSYLDAKAASLYVFVGSC